MQVEGLCVSRTTRVATHSYAHTLRDIDLGKKEPEEGGGSSSSPGASAPDDCGSRSNSNTRPREFHHTQTHAHYLPPRPTRPSAAVPSELHSLWRGHHSTHTHCIFASKHFHAASPYLLSLEGYGVPRRQWRRWRRECQDVEELIHSRCASLSLSKSQRQLVISQNFRAMAKPLIYRRRHHSLLLMMMR